MESHNKPLSDSYKQFLDDLRDSGEINMFGAPAVLQREFGVSKELARSIVIAWMEDYRG